MKIERIYSQTHEKVLSCTDPVSGLRAFIAIHDTTLGPALGGCRMWHYDNAQEAMADALRLSAGMTAKSALAGVPFGGGKAVIMADPRTEKTPEKMRAMGRFIESLKGEYISGEDVGMTPQDLLFAAEETEHVVGLPEGPYASGDPSPVTAEGVFRCMRTAARLRLGSADLAGLTVAVQGLGHVGMVLAEKLSAAGARLIVADPNKAATARAARDLGARVVLPEEIVAVDSDIFAPCALGGVVNAESLGKLTARVVCGSANNQLASPDCAAALHSRNILYCPDYVVNSGGLISVAREALRIKDTGWMDAKLDEAVNTFAKLAKRALKEKRPPLDVADRMVADILAEARDHPKAI